MTVEIDFLKEVDVAPSPEGGTVLTLTCGRTRESFRFRLTPGQAADLEEALRTARGAPECADLPDTEERVRYVPVGEM